MPPAKPLPVEVPVTSTNWPTTKWSTVSSAPTGISPSSSTRNSASLRFGSTFATAKWPRMARGVFCGFALPDAELNGDIAVLIQRAVSNHLAIIDFQHSDRNMFTCIGKDAGHADLLGDDA